MLMFVITAIAATAAPLNVLPGQCALSATELAANAKLSFDAFDQQEASPKSARTLVNHGCWSTAAAATQHYLLHGPAVTYRQQRTLMFHLAQQLANSGEEQRAAAVVAGTRHPDELLDNSTKLRWNDFVRAHWAFFAKDQAMLKQARVAMESGQGDGNRLNAVLVDGLIKCFDRPYREAVSAPCRVAPPTSPVR